MQISKSSMPPPYVAKRVLPTLRVSHRNVLLTQRNQLRNQQSGKCTTQIVREEDMDPGQQMPTINHLPQCIKFHRSGSKQLHQREVSGNGNKLKPRSVANGTSTMTHRMHLFSLGTHQACNLLSPLPTCRSSCRSHILRGFDVVKGPIVLGIPHLVPNEPSYCWLYP